MNNQLPDVLQTDSSLRASVKEQKDTLSETLWSPQIAKKSQNWFLALAESVANLLVSNNISNGNFAKNQISDKLSEYEDWRKNTVFVEIPV